MRPCWYRLHPLAPGYILSVLATSPQFRRHPFMVEGCIPLAFSRSSRRRRMRRRCWQHPRQASATSSLCRSHPLCLRYISPRTVAARPVDFFRMFEEIFRRCNFNAESNLKNPEYTSRKADVTTTLIPLKQFCQSTIPCRILLCLKIDVGDLSRFAAVSASSQRIHILAAGLLPRDGGYSSQQWLHSCGVGNIPASLVKSHVSCYIPASTAISKSKVIAVIVCDLSIWRFQYSFLFILGFN